MRFNAVCFDFAAKQVAELTVGEARAAIGSGTFVWLDIEYVEATDVRRALADLGVPGEGMIEELFNTEANTLKYLAKQ